MSKKQGKALVSFTLWQNMLRVMSLIRCTKFVRPHLDYGDVIYHRDDPEMNSGLTKRLESVQYSVALTVAGAWRGSSYDKLLDELAWEYLYHRRWFRRL